MGSAELVFTWWPHEAPVTRLCLRGHGKAPLILSAGDCAAVSQFIPGDKQQELTQLYMTHGSPLTWVEWLDKELFLTSDSGGSVHLHKWDLEKLTKKIHQGTYEDKEEPRRKLRITHPLESI